MPDPEDAHYRSALQWLYSRTRGGGRRTPERAARLLSQSQLAAPPLTISVVGTNGKGSVTAMTAAGLSAAGHRTGRFISPHVESFLERVAVDGVNLSPRAVTEFVKAARARSTDAELPPAFFEWTLALALTEFQQQGVGAAVLEAGVGGASDATRAVQGVGLVVLTTVDFDHADSLGPTLADIARDKAGAARAGAPLVSGVLQPELREVVARRAQQCGATLHQYLPGARDQALFRLPASLEAPLRAAPPTRRHNARLAAAALRLAGVDEAAVSAGLRAPPLPARGELFRLPGVGGRAQVEVLLDGAHDPAAGRMLLEAVAGRPYVLLFAALGRKQGQALLRLLAPGASGVVLTEAASGEGHAYDWPAAPFIPDAEAALTQALSLVGSAPAKRPSLLLVTGSLYLAGAIRPLLRARGSRLPAPWEPAGA